MTKSINLLSAKLSFLFLRYQITDGPFGGRGGKGFTHGGEVYLNGPITAIEIWATPDTNITEKKYTPLFAIRVR